MVLEATIICVDNSEWMRNGDYFPTRMEAQIDAVNVIMGWKFQDNPENTVGVLKMAKNAEVLVTPTPDVGKALNALHSLRIGGRADVLAAVQVSQLALKHRQNKNQHQRMVLFIGSPMEAPAAALTRLGAALKKNNVAVDVVLFGEIEHNRERLEAFVKAANSNDNSHLLVVEPVPGSTSSRILTDAIRASPLSGRPTAAGAAGGEGGEEFPFGIDPNEDPELAMAIRASLEEERRRQEREQKEKNETAGGSASAGEAATSVPDVSMGGLDDDEEALLQQAIALSMQAAAGSSEQQQPPASEAPTATAPAATTSTGPTPMETEATGQEAMTDPEFLNSVLQSLPGVDPSDPQIQAILQGFQQGSGQQQQQQQKDQNKPS